MGVLPGALERGRGGAVMILWFASFLLVRHVGLPSAVRWLGFNCRELSARGLALYSLSADVVEMFVGLFVLFQCLDLTSLCPGVGSATLGPDGLRRLCWDARYSRS